MEPKVVDNIAAEVSDSIEKFAEKKQIPVEDKEELKRAEEKAKKLIQQMKKSQA